jgi:hypothetical protein
MLLQLEYCVKDACSPGSNIEIAMQVLIAAFLAILFLQSGSDKVNNRKSNLEWLKGHFANSPFRNTVPLLLTLITILELASGTLSAAGIISLLWKQCDYWIFWGCLLSAVSLLCLFFGQRVAKDYAGAQSLASYFIITLIGMWLCM